MCYIVGFGLIHTIPKVFCWPSKCYNSIDIIFVHFSFSPISIQSVTVHLIFSLENRPVFFPPKNVEETCSLFLKIIGKA